MRWGSAAIVLLGVVTVSAQAPPRDLAPSKVRTGTIRGRVLAAADGSPIRKARVSLSATDDDGDPVLTDEDGRFEFSALAAGHYSITAAKAGYATTAFGARRFLDRSIPVVLAPGGLAERIDVRLPKGAAITGRIVDDQGDPLLGINVTAGRVLGANGRLRLASAASTQTDDLGEYRLGGLLAGRYVVRVSSGSSGGSGMFLVDAATEGGSPWPETYYPGTASLAQAQAVPVRVGEELSAIDVMLAPARVPTLTIGVTDPLGQPAGGNFTLVSTSGYGALNRSGRVEDGYGWAYVARGEWMLLVRGPQGIALTPVSADSDDLSINLVTKPPGRISGRMVFEGSSRTRAAGITLEAIPQDESLASVGVMRATATVNRDDTFTMSDLIGTRRFRLRGGPGGVRLKSLTLKGQNLLDGPVTFAGGEHWTGVTAVVTDTYPELRGTVVDREHATVTDYSVLVFPDDRSRWADPSRWLRWVRADQHGTFAIDDLPSGRYFAAALSDVDGVGWSDPSFLDSIRPHATPFELGESETRTVALRLVSAP